MNRLRRFLQNPEIIGPPDCPLMLRWTILDCESPTSHSGTRREGASGMITQAEQALTLIKLPRWLTRDRKLMIHQFLPNVEERDFHDHPRSFRTFVLRGHYFDLVPCSRCDGKGYTVCLWQPPGSTRKRRTVTDCFCKNGRVLGEVMKAGMFRFRPAKHIHITQASAEGAWTVVWMLPLERKWGFWHQGEFLPWRMYKERFGYGMQCPTDEEREEAVATWEG